MKKPINFILLLYSMLAVLTIILFNGTGDAGDSIMHYLFAKYAPVHPQLYFDHWAKPVYVLLASPFAQFGFTGIKIFNVINSLFTILLTYNIAVALKLKNAYLVALILIFSPLNYILTFSGLTEPLFALFLSGGIYLVIQQKPISSSLLISFLPFVRSEGLIILGIFALYFLVKRNWKVLPWLLTGSILYSLAGYPVYHNLLWVFQKIPYITSSSYGSGDLFHFVYSLLYVMGVPLYFLFWTGCIALIVLISKRKVQTEISVLIVLGFFSFFIAHSLFWYFGLFHSLGMTRVLISVMPLISILVLFGFNLLTEEFFQSKKQIKFILQGLLILYILVFPFTLNPAAINWKKNMMLSVDQQTAAETVRHIRNETGTGKRFIYAHPYLAEALNIDWFDTNCHVNLNEEALLHSIKGDVIIWESWFARTESGIQKKSLDQDSSLLNLFSRRADDHGTEIVYSVYLKK